MEYYSIILHDAQGMPIGRFGCTGQRDEALHVAEEFVSSGGNALVLQGARFIACAGSTHAPAYRHL